jgi:tRNA pseudouridine55 synthase
VADGFLLVDKASGWTSHDVVARCRGILGERKIGHAGTLDPMATGLLVLGVGKATRLMRYIQEGLKRYEATIAFGIATDTLDADGAILEREPMDFEETDLAAVLPRFTGTIVQVPPMVSALKIGGRRLYDLAREGKEVEREPRQVEITELTLRDFAPGKYPEADIEVVCGSGTYIRSLADDIAQSLGGRAHLTALRRTAIGPHRVADAITVDGLAAAGDPGQRLMPMADGLVDMESRAVDDDTQRAIGNGMVLPVGVLDMTDPGTYRVLDAAGILLATYVSDGRRAKPEVVVA